MPDTFSTIKEAVENSQAGDTILIAPGIYKEQIIINKDITLIGSGIDSTILRESVSIDDSSVILINNAKVTLEDIQFYGGAESEGGRRGLIAVNSDITVIRCAFVLCFNVSIAAINGTMNIDNVIITCIRDGNKVIIDSSSTQGPGVTSDIGILLVNSHFSINNFTGGAAIDHIIDIRPSLDSNPLFLGKNYPADTNNYSQGSIKNSNFFGSRLAYWGQGIRIFGDINKHRPEVIIQDNIFKGQVFDSSDAVPGLYTTAGISFNGANGFAEISGNQISNFNSGICFYGLASANIHDNIIINNGRYGVVTSWAVNFSSQPDLGGGEYNSPGRNTIMNNGIYNICNLNSNPLSALNNWWGTKDILLIDSLIYDDDESSLYGQVNFMPVIPVEITSFSSRVSGSSITLTWFTATETNNAGFEIQRKPYREEDWQTAGFIQGAGTTASSHAYSFTDNPPAGRYNYRIKQKDFDGTNRYYGNIEIDIPLINNYILYQNYPNPFNPVTTIQYEIPAAQQVSLKVYDALGKEVTELVNEFKNQGTYRVRFDAGNLASGIYFYSINEGSFRQTKKLVVIK